MTKIIIRIFFFLLIINCFNSSKGADFESFISGQVFPPDSLVGGDTSDVILPFPFPDEGQYERLNQNESPLFLKRPSNIRTEIEYDPKTNSYIYTDKIGNLDYRNPVSMDFNDYRAYELNSSLSEYWQERAQTSTMEGRSGLIPQLKIGGEVFDRIFGSNTVDIRPQGSAELIFQVKSNKREDPNIDPTRRRTTNFDFRQQIQMNVMAKIGDKIEFNTNYNTEATFSFENKLKLKYEGKEDEIVKLIEAGDVTLPLNSTLITGSQSLFGLKTKLQFGKTTVTAVFSEQKAQTSTITVQGGAQTTRFEIKADQYEENKHFFLGHTFRDHPQFGYEAAISELPLINSNVNITKIEIWMTTRGPADENNRNIVALADLGEGTVSKIGFENPQVVPANVIEFGPFPDNQSNTLLNYLSDTSQMRDPVKATEYMKGKGLSGGRDFEYVGFAKRLDPSEYTVNSKLGFVSLNIQVPPDAVLAVAYQYQVIGREGVFQVGEFSDEGITGNNNLIVKLLKSTSVSTEIPMWDLMMKNVYSVGGYQLNKDDFMLNILYSGNNSGVPTGYLEVGPANVNGVPLVRVMNLDNLDFKNDRVEGGDGVFDYVDNAASNGGTINSRNGRVYFPVLEPFGGHIHKVFGDQHADVGNQLAYDELYRLTKTEAQQFPKKNKFMLEGIYKSSIGSEISLNALNIPQGSVRVTAGGSPLVENQDYTVDYTLGRVRITNEGVMNSGTPINISLESQTMFNVITQRMMGAHVDYKVDNDFNIGATILNLHESPITQKTNFGDEPISNTIWGVDMHYARESRFLTKMIDKLPFFETKEPSRITADGEFAQFIPGHSRAVGKEGTSYIDDFEGSQTSMDIKSPGMWYLASTPQEQLDLFPEASPGTGRAYGYNRAKIAWYRISQLFYGARGIDKPANLNDEEIEANPYTKMFSKQELFRNAPNVNGNNYMDMLNLAYYPKERGPYNYDVEANKYSSGLNEDGTLNDPDSRWGGIMRKLDSPDFEAANVEYIQFWILDPYLLNPDHKGGDLYINLGEISEDLMRDGRIMFENGIPTSGELDRVQETDWGYVPTTRNLTSSFDDVSNDETKRANQDVGYDGLTDDNERIFFDQDYISKLSGVARQNAIEDPSADNYMYYLGADLDNNPEYSQLLNRYKYFNNPQGNSPAASTVEGTTNSTVGSRLPNKEDINNDNTLTTDENYYQYKVSLRREDLKVGENFISDFIEGDSIIGNGIKPVWYQVKIPIRRPQKVVGNIQGFKSIRFMRLFLKEFEEEVICRFAALELVRGEWRRFDKVLVSDGEYLQDEDGSTFDVAAVNREENSARKPIPYVKPPGIELEQNYMTTQMSVQNEQSLALEVCGLADGMGRAIYKTTDFDFRQYGKLKMYVHAEQTMAQDDYDYGDLTAFIRLGSDYSENYYEYEIPLKFTDWNQTSDTDIWPEINEMELELQKLVQLKKDRRSEMDKPGSNVSTAKSFVRYDGKNKMTMKGVPNIGDVKVLMIGVRNPKRQGIDDTDDGLEKCAEVWINELRLTDFDNESGWAATGRIRANLADLGDVSFTGMYSTPGFGSIDKKVNDRQQELMSQFDVATNLDFGKFLPKESGWRIPMHYDYSEMRATPQYNPLDPDISYKDELSLLEGEAKKEFKNKVQDVTIRKNINFVNVRKDNVGASNKSMPYDVENFDVSYTYSELNQRNVDVEFFNKKEYSGGLGYNFAMNSKPVTPFKKMKAFSGKSFRMIKDFNFYYMPKLISIRTDMTREYSERRLRNKSVGNIIINTNYIKDWQWRRTYNVKYDLTRSIKINYDANANAYIYEPAGAIQRDNRDEYQKYRDEVLSDIMDLGTMNRFNQNVSIQYAVPINKIPLFDWVTLNTSYSAAYSWQAAPKTIQERVGNTIENSQNIQVNSNLRMTNLYNKIPYLKELNRSSRKSGRSRGTSPQRPKPKGKDTEGENAMDLVDDSTNKVNYFKLIADNSLKVLMLWKDASITYSERNGMMLPGFMPEPTIFGTNLNQNAPGWGFVFGMQDDVRPLAAQNGWITQDSLLNNPFLRKQTNDLNIRAKLEPIRGFTIDLTAVRTETFNHRSYFTSDEFGEFMEGDKPNEYSKMENGSFSMSYLMFGTSFDKIDQETLSSGTFEAFKDGRMDVAQRLGDWNNNSIGDTLGGWPKGYGPTSQEVLIPAFLAAYSGKSANTISLNPFPRIPLPNWNIRYNNLTDIEFVAKAFKSVSLSHSYQSDYTVNSWATNASYEEKNDFPAAKNSTGDFFSNREIGVVMLSERYSPLIGLDMNMHNDFLLRVQIKKSRNLALSFVNNQLTDEANEEYVIGLGYKFKKVPIRIIIPGGKKKRLESDLSLKLDFKLRDQKIILRSIDIDGENIPSRGNQIVSLNAAAEYTVNQKMNVRFFYEQTINQPFIQNQYNSSNSQGGISIRFTLAQ
ncbi:MAG: cell surface protein SprA [Bacteroidales bacterium]|nr:cell surface protein SprA [Bacteroidales bacterium]